MELIVAVCRTLANRPRLRLLQAIYAQPDITVHKLADAVGQPLYTASHHLKLLSNYRFIHMEPSGRHVYCQPIQQSLVSNEFLRALHMLLRDLFAHGNLPRALIQVCAAGSGSTWEAIFDALVKAFTTYTHLRRLLILREVAARGVCTTTDLKEAIGMSSAAMDRHIDKLRRRHLLVVAKDAEDQLKLALLSGPVFHRKLWELVRRELNTA